MSAYTNSKSADWLQLKHSQRPSRFGIGCGMRDSDWDYLDAIPARCGYTFVSEDAPVQLLNNHGGMDDDEHMVKDVWTPYQQMAAAAEEQVEPVDMGVPVNPSNAMDMDVDMDIDCAPPASNGQQFQPGTFNATMVSPSNKKKRSLEDLELNTGVNAQCQPQSFQFDNKRVRLGA
ncbi:hypothetical protein EX30DRAFT_22259 [Ascodesmis nigricans]|uniref:Uncharacterized protein n=1 Tax=Ascodesmis nigricans TaxID=341454 RepID=A0A4S2N7P4_9PEZI|nr:hypothetical protein EX30DRAFT_22259 [Ascodesmis nigricans]